MGLNWVLLFFFRKHHGRVFTYSDTDANSNTHSYANTEPDPHAKPNSDSQPNPYADSRAGHCGSQPRYLRTTGKPEL